MNNQICAGLVATENSFEALMDKGDASALDPSKTMVYSMEELESSDSMGRDKVDLHGGGPCGAVAMCRAVYDEKKYGQGFCCQGIQDIYDNE